MAPGSVPVIHKLGRVEKKVNDNSAHEPDPGGKFVPNLWLETTNQHRVIGHR